MTFSTLTEGRTWPLNYWRRPKDGRLFRRYDARGRAVDRFVVHHAAGTSDDGLRSQYASLGRQLSSTYAITRDGRLIGIVSEAFKPNTSRHAIDYRAVTVEVVNDGGELGAGNPRSWTVSAAAFDTLARLIADVSHRHGFPIDRTHIIQHREVDSTRCPGEYLVSRFDELLALARKYRAAIEAGPPATTPVPEEDDMGFTWEDRHLLGLVAKSMGRVEVHAVNMRKQLGEVDESVDALTEALRVQAELEQAAAAAGAADPDTPPVPDEA